MKVSRVSLSMAGLALAPNLHAAPEIEIGSEYQLNVVHSDNGLNEEAKQSSTTSFNLKGAKVVFRGKLSDDISWTVLYKAKESELERIYVTHRVNENLELTLGKQKNKLYGLHRKLTSGVTTPVVAAHLAHNPMKDRVAIDITYKLAGSLSLQLIDDYSCAPSNTSCKSWNQGKDEPIVTNSSETQTVQKQPAAAFEWYGSFGELSPLVQYAVYDLGKSSSASAGLRYKTETVDAYFDYTMDTRNNKGVDSTDPTKSAKEKTTYTGMVVYGEFKTGLYSPFVHFSTLATDPFQAPGSTEVDTVASESNGAGKLDRNAMIVAVGTHFENWGAYYRPFVDVTLSRGEFVDPSNPTKKEDRTKTDLVAGLIGKF
ncbi:porin [Oligoflexus tunisiensis]|uniref:porin n=1 Tax=Oligoflexus tunisiensis TaxID=708132 RepID=UPI00159F00EF|nr:porin [Oligoflexus tunisiensis]